jgi:hypothetical protein
MPSPYPSGPNVLRVYFRNELLANQMGSKPSSAIIGQALRRDYPDSACREKISSTSHPPRASGKLKRDDSKNSADIPATKE